MAFFPQYQYLEGAGQKWYEWIPDNEDDFCSGKKVVDDPNLGRWPAWHDSRHYLGKDSPELSGDLEPEPGMGRSLSNSLVYLLEKNQYFPWMHCWEVKLSFPRKSIIVQIISHDPWEEWLKRWCFPIIHRAVKHLQSSFVNKQNQDALLGYR